MPDHIHIFVSVSPDISISNLVKEIKVSSTDHVNEKRFSNSRFSWQSGYGAFSHSFSQVESVIKYIDNQEKHHKKRTFKEEYLEILKKFKIEYDLKYVFNEE